MEKCPECGSKEFIGEIRTFDTWFDSANSEIYILGYLWDKEFFKKNFPCTLRPQGKEIVRNWLYYTLLKAFLLFEAKSFENVWLHMHIVDEKGKKMSKSKGNVIDPQDVLKKYGTEAFRIWTCLEGDITRGDIRCSFERYGEHCKHSVVTHKKKQQRIEVLKEKERKYFDTYRNHNSDGAKVSHLRGMADCIEERMKLEKQ